MTTVDDRIEVEVPHQHRLQPVDPVRGVPAFMDGIESVKQLDDTQLHWTAEIAGVRREWDARIVEQEPGADRAWENVDGATQRRCGDVPADRRRAHRGVVAPGVRARGRRRAGRRQARHRRAAGPRATSSASRSSSSHAAPRPARGGARSRAVSSADRRRPYAGVAGGRARQGRGCSLKLWSNGPKRPMLTRHTLACARWQWNMISIVRVERPGHGCLDRRHVAHDDDVLVEDPWRQRLERRAHAGVERAEALAALRREQGVRAPATATPRAAPPRPARPRTRRRRARSTGRRLTARLEVGRGLPGAHQRAADHHVARGRPCSAIAFACGDRSRRAAGRAGPAAARSRWRPCGRGGRGRARASVNHRSVISGRGAQLPGATEPGPPLRIGELRPLGTIHQHSAMPASSSGTFHHPRAATGWRASSKEHRGTATRTPGCSSTRR